MESVTRAIYTRSDLDLLLSSPAQAPKIFAVRIATIALSVMAMAALLAGPFHQAAEGRAHWLRAYGAIAAMGAAAAAVAVGLTTALFRTIGPRRTRLVAQIVAAVIGAAFVIVARYLDEHCPDARLRLCPYRHKLPRTADEFLWSVERYMPATVPAMRAARQQHGEVSFRALSEVQVPPRPSAGSGRRSRR